MNRTCVHHTAGVAQPHDALSIQYMSVDTRHLRRRVCTQTELSTARLIRQLERTQIEIATSAGQQGLSVLDQRRYHQFVAVAAVKIEQGPPQMLDAPCFAR